MAFFWPAGISTKPQAGLRTRLLRYFTMPPRQYRGVDGDPTSFR